MGNQASVLPWKKQAQRKGVLTKKEWRFKEQGRNLFTLEHENKLKNELKDKFNAKQTKRANILLLGPIKAGKSSFINSVKSIVKGRYAEASQSGEAGSSYTKKFRKYVPRRRGMNNFNMFDCMGVECGDVQGLNLSDVTYLVNGNVPKNYCFDPKSPISKKTVGFKPNPEERDKIHCVLYVIDAETLSAEIPDAVKEKVQQLQDTLRDIPRVMVLTKIDKLCDEVDRDVALTYRSVAVRDMVDKASELFALPKDYIYPIKNYGETTAMDHKANILILMALEHMLRSAEDHLEELRSDESDESDE